MRLALVPILCGLLLTGISTRPSQALLHRSAAGLNITSLTTNLADLSAAVHVSTYDPAELEKVGADFKRTYALHDLSFQYKRPGRIRLEGKSPVFGKALLVLNGATRYYSVAKLRLHKSEDLQSAPVKRQSLLDYVGLVPQELLRFMKARFVKEDSVGTGSDPPADLFDLSYVGAESGPHYQVWIDPKTRVTIRRKWFDSANRLRATFLYERPREVAPGDWVPLRIEVQNADGVTALVLDLTDVKANAGLPDSLFQVDPA